MYTLETIKTEQIGADLSKVVDKIIKQYESFPKAFQKEAIQNAWDERLDKKKATNWEIKIYTDSADEQAHLVVEDFGTKGMDEERWDAFLSLWKPKKEELDAGGQGQGKFVLMGASKKNILIVESISDEILYRCKFLQNDRKSCGECSIKDFVPNAQALSHKGTKIWVYDIKGDFLNSINAQEFVDSIAETWWQILADRFAAKICLFGKDIIPPKLPSPREELTLLENKPLGDFGRIKRMVLQFYDEPIAEIFQGVRVQRANMMIVRIPFEVYDKEYQNRFSGYIEFDDILERLLKDIERTDHCGFLSESPWKEIKSLVKEESEKFVDKIIPKKAAPKVFLPKNLNTIIQKANQIIIENCPDLQGPGTIVPPISKKSKPFLRLDYLVLNKREVKYGDTIKPSCRVVNEADEDKKCLLRVELKREGQRFFKEEYKLKIGAEDKKPLKLSEIELTKEDYPKGKYTIRATIQEDTHDVDTKATSFYLEIKREPAKRGFIKNIEPFESNEPIRNKPINKGVIEINFAHKDFLNVYEVFSKMKKQNEQIGFYLIKICLDEAISALYKVKLKDLGNQDLDDIIKEINRLKDRMYYEVYI
ncbi:MAG: hypothetical protein FJ005_01940 [Chloroflexi bacterium]|nr:hypothetical protein [Chloroflexota bacterium]